MLNSYDVANCENYLIINYPYTKYIQLFFSETKADSKAVIIREMLKTEN
jgi:hypothetical protein